MRPKPALVRLLWTLTVPLSLIGVAIVVRRLLFYAGIPSASPASLDTNFLRHPVLTMVHIIPGLLFIILGPFQFMKRVRARRLALHRWMGRVFIGSGLVVGISALVMAPQMAV